MPIIGEILELKLKYWEKIINGYQHINDFAGFTIRVSESINRFVLKLEEQLDTRLFGAVVVKQFNRISQLKILSLFYGAIANDMQNVIPIYIPLVHSLWNGNWGNPDDWTVIQHTISDQHYPHQSEGGIVKYQHNQE